MTTSPSLAPVIFVSHKSCDANVARELQQALDDEFLGYPTFFNASDHDSLQPGTAWFESIVEALRNTSVQLVILSPKALESPWVNFEAGAAWIQGALIIPCCIGQVTKGSLPVPYSHLQGVDLDDANDLDLLFKRLAAQTGLRFTSRDREPLAKRLVELWRDGAAEEQLQAPIELGNRIDEHLEVEWFYSESLTTDECWAARDTTSSRFRVVAEQVDSIAIELTPSVEAVTFAGVNTPNAELLESSRSSSGRVRLAPAHASSGRFAIRVNFDPPLQEGDTAAYKIRLDFPAYKFAVRERLAQALMDIDAKLRDYEYTSRRISRPCERFSYRVILPKRLGSTPLAPEILINEQPFEEERRYVIREPGVFTIRDAEIEGEPCWIAEMDRFNPPYRATYRFRWVLPRRGELESSSIRTE
jgi:hypothetical protein